MIEKITTTIVTDENELALAAEMDEESIDEFSIVLKLEIHARNNFPIAIYDPSFTLDYHVFEPNFDIDYFYGDDELCQVNWITASSDLSEIKAGAKFTAVGYHAINNPYYLCQSVHVSGVEFSNMPYATKTDDYESYAVNPQKSPYFKFNDYSKDLGLIYPVSQWHGLSFIGDPWDNSEYEDFINAGAYHIVYVRDDCTVGFAGRTDNKRCDVETWSDIIAVDASSHAVGLKSDGTVVATGPNGKKQCNVSKWENIVAIATGSEHTIGLKFDGTVVAVGNKAKNRLKVSVVAIDAGGETTYGLGSDGTVVAVGSNSSGQTKITDWEDITTISAGNRHVVGLKSDGTVVATGNNKYGQCNVSNWNEIEKIVAGDSFVIGLEGGYYVFSGSNGYGQCDLK